MFPSVSDHLPEGWRLPTLDELIQKVDRSRCDPAHVPDGVTNIYPIYYWTSTKYVGDEEWVWVIDFETGAVELLTTRCWAAVLPVRDVTSNEG